MVWGRVGWTDPRVGDFVPFRDAAFGLCTYALTILDCLRGVQKAITCSLFSYSRYGRVGRQTRWFGVRGGTGCVRFLRGCLHGVTVGDAAFPRASRCQIVALCVVCCRVVPCRGGCCAGVVRCGLAWQPQSCPPQSAFRAGLHECVFLCVFVRVHSECCATVTAHSCGTVSRDSMSHAVWCFCCTHACGSSVLA